MYFITIKRMLEVCFSAHPNIQYRASIYTDIRKLQDKAKTSYTLSTRRLRFGYE